MNLLVVTDSRTHSENESFYQLITELSSKGYNIDIVDRSQSENEDFFSFTNINKPSIYRVSQDGLYYDKYQKDRCNTVLEYLRSYNVVFLRIDRPVSDAFLWFIEKALSQSVIINSPKGIIETSTKEYLFNFPHLCTDMTLCESIDDVYDYFKKFPIVLKPLKGYRGKGIIRLDKNASYYENKRCTQKEINQIIYSHFSNGDRLLAVKFLKNVSNGDKRILVVNSQIVGGFTRVPRHGSWLANLAHGAKPVESSISEQDIEIAKALSNDLQKKGVIMFGFDVLQDDDGLDVLSEVNTLNVGGFVEAKKCGCKSVISDSVKYMLRYIEEKANNRMH